MNKPEYDAPAGPEHEGRVAAGRMGWPAPPPTEDDLRQLDEAWNDSAFYHVAVAESGLVVAAGPIPTVSDPARPPSPVPKGVPGTADVSPAIKTIP